MTYRRFTFAGALTLLVSLSVFADVRLPALISDHMVLQHGMNDPIWGWADPGEAISVAIGGQTKTAKADKAGKWSIRLDKLESAEPLTMTVKGNNTLTVQDILVGEVWLASGQSNMAMQVKAAKDFEAEKVAAQLPQIRMFTVVRSASLEPRDNCEGQWVICSPETVGDFSATAYFFAREVHKKLQVPVGILHASWGGTAIQRWTSIEAMQHEPQLRSFVDAYKKARKANIVDAKPGAPSDLYAGMIAPLVPYAIKGAIWYQGEANAKTPETSALYAVQLPTLIKDWRTRWNQGDFPFAWVQLPGFSAKKNAEGAWPAMRESMLRTLSVPNTGMAITIDIGDPGNIHPKNKQEVGRRLALWALGDVYKQDVPATSGPLFARSMAKGNKLILSFSHADGGLIAKDGELRAFEISGSDGKWHPAKAQIRKGRVIVSSPDVIQPVAVRYDWANDPDGNLYNAAGLPASPFRTR